jgi:hypothetical protein
MTTGLEGRLKVVDLSELVAASLGLGDGEE